MCGRETDSGTHGWALCCVLLLFLLYRDVLIALCAVPANDLEYLNDDHPS